MLKLTVYNYWRDANNYRHEKNTPVLQDNSLFRAVFRSSEQIYCENITLFYFYKWFKKKIKKNRKKFIVTEYAALIII